LNQQRKQRAVARDAHISKKISISLPKGAVQKHRYTGRVDVQLHCQVVTPIYVS